MTEYGWILPVAWVFLCIGIAMALSTWIMYDKRKDKRIKKMVMSDDSWCWQNCKHLEECFSKHKDPDDAMKELDDEYCWECPMAKAIDEWIQQEAMKQRGKKP